MYLLQLENYWEKEIASGRTRRKMQGIRILDELTTDVISGVFAPLLYHRNDDLRKIARSEFVKFEEQDAFRFFEDEDFDNNFNRLDEIRLHSSFKQKHDEGDLPLLSQWIQNVNNVEVKCFLIREIAFFNQVGSASHLLEIFKSTGDSKIQTEIARTLGILKYEDALPVFTSQFQFYKMSVQYAIVDAIGQIGKKENLPFLEGIYGSAHNEKMKIKIEEAIQQCNGQNNINVKHFPLEPASYQQ